MDEKSPVTRSNVPLFSLVRFGPGSIMLLSFIGMTTIVLYLSGLKYVAVLTGSMGILLFGVKSMERIQLSYPKERKLVGETCIVVKRVERGQQGIVKICLPDGRPDPELWSAESEHEIEKGKKAKVTGIRSIVLLIEPLNPTEMVRKE